MCPSIIFLDAKHDEIELLSMRIEHRKQLLRALLFNMTGITVLGISPGTRYVGIAMLRDGELYKWRIKSYGGICTPEKIEKSMSFIESLIISHVVHAIACKVPHAGRMSSGVIKIIERIKEIAKQYKIECKIYSIEDLRTLFKMKFSNRYILAEHVTKRFPQLNEILIRERKNKHKYHIRAFEAIAAGLRYHHELTP